MLAQNKTAKSRIFSKEYDAATDQNYSKKFSGVRTTQNEPKMALRIKLA